MSFLANLRQAQYQAGQQQLQGQARNAELDQLAKNHWGRQAYDATVNAIAHAKAAFTA